MRRRSVVDQGSMWGRCWTDLGSHWGRSGLEVRSAKTQKRLAHEHHQHHHTPHPAESWPSPSVPDDGLAGAPLQEPEELRGGHGETGRGVQAHREGLGAAALEARRQGRDEDVEAAVRGDPLATPALPGARERARDTHTGIIAEGSEEQAAPRSKLCFSPAEAVTGVNMFLLQVRRIHAFKRVYRKQQNTACTV